MTAMGCPSHWSSTGDLRVSNSTNCDVSTIFVRCCFGIAFFTGILLLIKAIVEVQKRLYKARMSKEKFQIKKFVNLIAIVVVISLIPMLILSIRKVIEPERAIGSDPTLTWSFTICAIITLYLLHLLFGLFITMSIHQERFRTQLSMTYLLRFVRFFLPFLVFVLGIAYSLPLVSVYYPAYAGSLIQSFWLIQGICVLIFGLSFPLVVHSVCRDLDLLVKNRTSINLKELQKMREKFRSARLQGFIRSLINSAITLTFGIVAQARYWSPYIVGLQVLFLPLIYLGALKMISTSQNSTSSLSTGHPPREILSVNSKEKLLCNFFCIGSKSASKEVIGSYQGSKESDDRNKVVVASTIH